MADRVRAKLLFNCIVVLLKNFGDEQNVFSSFPAQFSIDFPISKGPPASQLANYMADGVHATFYLITASFQLHCCASRKFWIFTKSFSLFSCSVVLLGSATYVPGRTVRNFLLLKHFPI